jgi:hypothetical protein
LTGQLLARILMWAVIIAMVWYFAQQWNRGAPSEQQHEAMMDAARSYREYQGQMQQEQAPPETELPRTR